MRRSGGSTVDILETMRLHTESGLYVIFNLVDRKAYVGQGEIVGRRASEQWRKLRRGDHDLPRLQEAWNRVGESAFAIEFHPVPLSKLNGAEADMIERIQALEHLHGYNKMLSRAKWGPEARLRNLEDKLVRYRKFCRLKAVPRESPMTRQYIDSICLAS